MALAVGARASAGERVLLAGLVALVAVIALWPLARLLLEGLAPNFVPEFTPLVRLWNSPAAWRAFWRTLETSLWGTALSLALGIGFALVASLSDARGKAALTFLFVLPLVIPAQITALAWIQLLSPVSPLLAPLGLAPPPGSAHPMFGPGGIIVLFGIEHAPFVYLALRAGLRALPRELIEAARAAGAGRGRVLITIVLPLMVPALAAGALLAFVSSVGNFGAPALLGIPVGYDTLVTFLYQRLSGFGLRVLREAGVLSLAIGLIALSGVVLHGWVTRRADVRIIGAGATALAFQLGRWRLAVEVACWLAVFALVIVPLMALVAGALVPAIGVALGPDTITFANFRSAIFVQASTIRAFTNSFLLSGTAALITALVAVPFAYFLSWRPSRLTRIIDPLIELPYALPGIVLAIAFIMTFIRPLPLIGVSLYNTIWIILVAYVARFMALSLRPVMAGFAQLDRALDEAAAAAGARRVRRFWDVTLPLVAPAAAAGAILVFLTALNEVTVSALLWTQGTETLGMIVYSLQEGGDSPLAAAVSSVSIALVIALMGLVTLLGRRLPPGVLPWLR